MDAHPTSRNRNFYLFLLYMPCLQSIRSSRFTVSRTWDKDWHNVKCVTTSDEKKQTSLREGEREKESNHHTTFTARTGVLRKVARVGSMTPCLATQKHTGSHHTSTKVTTVSWCSMQRPGRREQTKAEAEHAGMSDHAKSDLHRSFHHRVNAPHPLPKCH